MAHDDTLAKALTNVRHQREILQAEYERVGAELTKLRLAERSLAAIVEGAPMDELMSEPTSRRRASTGEDQPRAGRGPRGPRANSAKGRLKALLEEAGPQGLTHTEITERLTGVAANTLNTYLSVMSSSGELERHGDRYRAGTAASDASNEDPAEGEEEDSEQAEAAE
ncbi:hypothetical protein MKK88_01795 [Methylobacterium sp. E-005]|uniref:hypothetical protein n=1 Tax=Methylobacterium sp. E-005 TaxID=2836549 RepID=UPI001FB8B12C|nr:hypothetical protein [Methylobacterium sp. E-005]MCJ2084727.1 hypothetical protein [Methylobacterium sp. E-005]